jgi:hypothetical protein
MELGGSNQRVRCDHCRIAVMYRVGRSEINEERFEDEGSESCVQFMWRELLCAKDTCELCRANIGLAAQRLGIWSRTIAQVDQAAIEFYWTLSAAMLPGPAKQ